ncbi:MAG: DNA polymerase I [Clostridia bacterium]|nr:DNA polymerase I [Clostridia bacterium]
MSRLLLVDGNSIMNRAFYGIMGSKMLMTSDGTYTNAVYGFLAILFKELEDLTPDYIAVAFDLKAPTARHKMYEGYKANRHGMPDELREQMPIIKEVLRNMNITIIEREGYEADDVLGTLSRRGEEEGINVTILSGDRDTFQLASDIVTIRIPRTKAGKTEEEDFDRNKVLEVYGLEPVKLIEVKGLQGDTSDNIPGVPGIGEKTALSMIKEYGSIEEIYKQLDEGKAETIKGKTREKMIENKDLAFLSKTLGTINREVPIEEEMEEFKKKDWDNEKVLEQFKELKFNRFIERFNLNDIQNSSKTVQKDLSNLFTVSKESDIELVKDFILKQGKVFYYFELENDDKKENIIKERIVSVSIYNSVENKVYNINYKDNKFNDFIKEIFENENIEKYGYELRNDFIILKQSEIEMKNLKYDVKIAGYILDMTKGKYILDDLIEQYLGLNIEDYLNSQGVSIEKNKQITLFGDSSDDSNEDGKMYQTSFYAYSIFELIEKLNKELEETNQTSVFNNIDMPLATVLAKMQWEGMYVDKEELVSFGNELKQGLEILTKEIYDLAGEEFNINSTQQLGTILFEKLGLTTSKKNKKGYSTDVDSLEKIKNEHPIVEKILEYRSLMKLNSTYVEGMIPYINEKTNRIHSYFHQTITATGRISSSDPNLQNIPTRFELGKKLRKVFKPKEGYIYIDADYSQIELRVLAHISQDEHMLEAFKNGEDIHKQAASKVLGIPIDEVTKEQRSAAKAVNFGIIYGISDFGLAEQLGTSRKQAKEYIEQYLEKYNGIDVFMKNVVEDAKEKGYVETLFKRRRYITELKSNNYMVREFGKRAAMNTPIQGTAADIMKIAMINLDKELGKNNIDAKIVLQVHDELILEAKEADKEKAKELLKNCMESAIKLTVPLEVEVSEATNWYDCK